MNPNPKIKLPKVKKGKNGGIMTDPIADPTGAVSPPDTNPVPAPVAAAPINPVNSAAAPLFNAGGIMTSSDVSTVKPATGNAAQWSVSPDQTVAGRVAELLKGDSPIMLAADTRSKQAMNARGLANTSMALQAGQQAVIDSAVPIASQDASTFANAAQFNAGAKNTMTATNINSSNQASIASADALNAKSLQAMDQAFKQQMQTADDATRVRLQTMQGETQKQLASIEADYKTLMQTSASATDIYRSTMANITTALADPNTDAAAKATIINGQIEYMKTGMNLISSINGVDVTDLLTFPTVEAG